jgi:hypothetical protein
MWWAVFIFALLIIVTVVVLTLGPKDQPPPSGKVQIVVKSAIYTEDERHCGGSMGSGDLIKNRDLTQAVTDLVNKGSINKGDWPVLIRPSTACGPDGGGVVKVTWSDDSIIHLYYGNAYTF